MWVFFVNPRTQFRPPFLFLSGTFFPDESGACAPAHYARNETKRGMTPTACDSRARLSLTPHRAGLAFWFEGQKLRLAYLVSQHMAWATSIRSDHNATHQPFYVCTKGELSMPKLPPVLNRATGLRHGSTAAESETATGLR